MVNPIDLVNKMIAQEREQVQILAPFSKGSRRVLVRILGIVCNLKVTNPPREDGFYIFEKLNESHCKMVREAPRALLVKYLENFPRASMVYIGNFNGIDYGLQESAGTQALQTQGPIPIRFLNNVAEFDSVSARFDGQAFYFEGRNKRRSGQSAQRLRDYFTREVAADKLGINGLLQAERTVYEMLLEQKLKALRMSTNKNLDPKTRAELALGMAGVKLNSMTNQHGGTSRVSFDLNGARHDVTVRTDTLQVVNSGICLSGRDSDFDLTSLVSVFNSKTAGIRPGDHDGHVDSGDDWDD